MRFSIELARPVVVLATLLAAAAAGSCGDGPSDAPVTVAGSPGEPTVMREGVTGIVLDADGEPLAGALVTPTSVEDVSPPIPEIAIVSGEDGRYEWPLRAGRYELEVTLEGYEAQSERVEVVRDRVSTVDFALARR